MSKNTIIEFNDIEIKKLRNINNFDEIKDINEKLYNVIFNTLKYNNDIEIQSNEKLFKNFKSTLKYNKEIDIFYDIILPYHSDIASYMIRKIKKFVYSVCDVNSKNVLIGDHKEKWGGIVGHVTVNRKDILIKILKYVINMRKQFPYISSSYSYSAVGFKIENYWIKKVNNYRKSYQFIWQKKQYKIYNKKSFFKSCFLNRNSHKHFYKNEVINNRKKIIKTKYRYTWRNNLK